jgi:hypothetical protein
MRYRERVKEQFNDLTELKEAINEMSVILHSIHFFLLFIRYFSYKEDFLYNPNGIKQY